LVVRCRRSETGASEKGRSKQVVGPNMYLPGASVAPDNASGAPAAAIRLHQTYGTDIVVRTSRARARVRALWGLSGWRGNERIADSIKKGPPGARAGGGCCSGSDRAPNFQGSAGRERNPVRGLAQLASLWLIACPASKLRHTCSDHCCRMGADCRELDGPLRPTARLSAIGTFARSTRARQANRFAERPEFLRPVRARQGLG
jgi:hypothetical protein